MTRRALLLALVTVLAVPSSLAAQARNLDIERFRPAPDREGFLGIPGTRTPGPWMWNASLWTGYTLDPLTVRRSDGTRIPIVRHRVHADVIAQLGITDRMALLVDVPMVVWQDADPTPLGDRQLAALALRDPYVAARVRVLGDGATGEHRQRDGAGLALQAAATLPFGLEHTFAGEGSPQLEGAVLADFHFLSFGVGAIVGYRHRFAEPRLIDVGFTNELFFGAAIASPLIFVDNTRAIVETRVETAMDDDAFVGASTSVETDLGVRWAEGDLAMTWLVGMGFGEGVGAPAFRGSFGFEWAPRTHDADGDGIVDSLERPDCVRLPEDFDGFQDDDGCPDPDNDGDLVPDEDDRCPTEAAELDRDENDDGCTDPPRDADRDGVIDSEDSCPDEPEDRDGFEDDDGCPDEDNDGDGVEDAVDRCRDEAEDADGFQDGDGCPDPDNDGDGVGDADDGCPLEAEDRDGFEDGDGCPDPDNDRDGVIDGEDQCLEHAETINGVDDADGCPDRGGRALWTGGTGDALRGRVRFDREGAIAGASSGAVDQLARHVIARWGGRWEIARAAGSAARIAALAAARARRGVEGARVVVDPSLSGTVVVLRRAVAPAPETPALAAPDP